LRNSSSCPPLPLLTYTSSQHPLGLETKTAPSFQCQKSVISVAKPVHSICSTCHIIFRTSLVGLITRRQSTQLSSHRSIQLVNESLESIRRPTLFRPHFVGSNTSLLGISKMARSYLGLLITGLTSFLFFYLGQAHLTSEYTPGLARKIEGWSEGCSNAWWWFALDAEPVRTILPCFFIPPLATLILLVIRHSSIEPYRWTSYRLFGWLYR
jgi:hypothetical protein